MPSGNSESNDPGGPALDDDDDGQYCDATTASSSGSGSASSSLSQQHHQHHRHQHQHHHHHGTSSSPHPIPRRASSWTDLLWVISAAGRLLLLLLLLLELLLLELELVGGKEAQPADGGGLRLRGGLRRRRWRWREGVLEAGGCGHAGCWEGEGREGVRDIITGVSS
jgi:hypothetical protein